MWKTRKIRFLRSLETFQLSDGGYSHIKKYMDVLLKLVTLFTRIGSYLLQNISLKMCPFSSMSQKFWVFTTSLWKKCLYFMRNLWKWVPFLAKRPLKWEYVPAFEAPTTGPCQTELSSTLRKHSCHTTT